MESEEDGSFWANKNAKIVWPKSKEIDNEIFSPVKQKQIKHVIQRKLNCYNCTRIWVENTNAAVSFGKLFRYEKNFKIQSVNYNPLPGFYNVFSIIFNYCK